MHRSFLLLPNIVWSSRILVRLLLPCLLVVGCANLKPPEDLAAPRTITCVNLENPTSYAVERGLLNIVWETTLARGPYISEKDDGIGTYYRGPPGAVSIARPEMADRPASVATHMSYDGGFWVPHDPKVPP